MGEHTSEKKPPLSDVTVVLLGHEDEAYRARVTRFYDAQDIRWLAVESRAGDDVQSALRHALQEVDTAYLVLAQESDVLLADALHAAANWLQEHPTEQMAQGYALGYRPDNSVVTYYKLGEAVSDDAGADPRARIDRHATSGLHAWRAVVRREAFGIALASLPPALAFDECLVALSYALLAGGSAKVLDCTSVLIECAPDAPDQVAREQALADLVRTVRHWDAERQAVCADDDGFVILRNFIHNTYPGGHTVHVFTSSWNSIGSEPERRFEPRQFVELPYYNARLFKQLTALEFFLHAWPVGRHHIQALEGAWVQLHDLLQSQASDTAESLQHRYRQALALYRFSPHVCRLLLATLTSSSDEAHAEELHAWLARLERVVPVDVESRLALTPSGRILDAIRAATPDTAGKQRIARHLASRQAPEIALVIFDTDDNNYALQRTFDSILASGLQRFRIVVLKSGKLPAITSERDTLHFVKVTAENQVPHLNQVLRQLSSDWYILLDAGDLFCAGGMLRLQVELGAEPECLAIAANEVQRDAGGRLISIVRPGADIDLLRSRPDVMSRHWLMKRQAVLDVGGYSEVYRRALGFDVLLRLVETWGPACLSHLDEYLVIGQQSEAGMTDHALSSLNRHLAQLGYRGQVSDQGEGRLHIDFRHSTTPLVSILVSAGSDLSQLQTCLTSVIQRSRYPRYEVLVACTSDTVESCTQALQGFGPKVRLLGVECGGTESELLKEAAAQARGDYLVFLSSRCQVVTPAWIEALLNQAERPEVGVVGARLLASNGAISHAGYELLASREVHSTWFGLKQATARQLGSREVRRCQAVSADCLMVRRDVFEQCATLPMTGGADIDLCLRVAEAGLLVLSSPHAHLSDEAVPTVTEEQVQWLFEQWPMAFSRQREGDSDLSQWLDEIDT
ncbi:MULTISPECIES: glycosyltransferase [unclassified Pseudomonas]|uniref:glycosyltransferase n=1 Tax=unclassified Pseudomonas TaxID=196821 RepID=UPI000B8134A7|nr:MULTISPECIES: glycosyltransferase [unclassified Pseudomonas]